MLQKVVNFKKYLCFPKIVQNLKKYSGFQILFTNSKNYSLFLKMFKNLKNFFTFHFFIEVQKMFHFLFFQEIKKMFHLSKIVHLSKKKVRFLYIVVRSLNFIGIFNKCLGIKFVHYFKKIEFFKNYPRLLEIV